MDISLYDQNGTLRFTVRPSDSSTQQKEIQGDNILSLSFTLYEHVDLDVNDYVDYEGERYRLMDAYQPQMKGRQQWQYDLKLYGMESLLKRFLVLNTTDGDSEPVFTLTAPPAEHLALIVACMNAGMGVDSFSVGKVEGTDNVVMDYEGTYCDEALKALAEKLDTEWWMDGESVNLCRCERGDVLTLGYSRGLTGLSRETADSDKFYTRLYPIGSSRNIEAESYGHSRLMLPDGKKYVDVNVDKYGVIDHYEADAFAGIYPRRVGTISSVWSEEETDDDGNTYKVYYVADKDLPFNPDDYMLDGKVLRMSFQEGSELAGLGEEEDGTYYFECNYNADRNAFELITIWPYDDDTQLPNDTLCPKEGDEYILWNLRMPDEYYTLAEEELAEAVTAYNAEHALDVAVYKGQTDHVWMEENGAELYVGRLIRLESEEYFGETGYRDSRITKLTRRVNLPGQVDVEISEALSTSGLSKLTARVVNVKSYVKTLVSGLTLPEVIRSWETTEPSDNNLLTGRRVLKEIEKQALSRQKDDEAAGFIRFLAGIGIGVEESKWQITKDGIATLYQLYVSRIENSGDLVNGGNITNGGDLTNKGTITTKDLTVTGLAHFFQLQIDKLSSVAGAQVISNAHAKVMRVVWYGTADDYTEGTIADGCDSEVDGYVYGDAPMGTFHACRLLWPHTDDDGLTVENEWVVGDGAACWTAKDFSAGTFTDASNKFWWAKVGAVGEVTLTDKNGDETAYNYIDILGTDVAETGDYYAGYFFPSTNDAVAQLGYFGEDADTLSNRGNAIIISAYGTPDMEVTPPSIVQYAAIATAELAPYRLNVMARSGNIFKGTFLSTAHGEEVDLITSITEIAQDMDGISLKVDNLRTGTTNLFCFRDALFSGTIPAIQLYGAEGVSTTSRIYHLGLNGEGGAFTLTCKMKMRVTATSVYVNMGDQAPTNGGTVSVGNDWQEYTFTWENVTQYISGSENGFIGFYSDDISAENRLYVRDIILMRGNVPAALAVSDKDKDDNDGGQVLGPADFDGGSWTADGLHKGMIVYKLNNPTTAGGYFDYFYASGQALDAGQYTMSVWAKASDAAVLSSYFYTCHEGICGIIKEIDELSEGEQTAGNSPDGWTAMYLTSEWRRYVIHWYKATSGTINVLPVRLWYDHKNNATADIYVAGLALYKGWWTAEQLEKGEKTSVIEDGLLATGIDIENRRIEATADTFVVKNNSGATSAVIDENGQLMAGSLKTLDGKVLIADGLMQFFGTLGFANIELGVDDDGCAVLKFYDKNGTFMYDLGPNGLSDIDNYASTFKTLTGYYVFDLSLAWTQTLANQLSTSGTTALYRFMEGRTVTGSIVTYYIGRDGDMTQTSEYNGRYYYSTDLSSSEKDAYPTGETPLVHIASVAESEFYMLAAAEKAPMGGGGYYCTRECYKVAISEVGKPMTITNIGTLIYSQASDGTVSIDGASASTTFLDLISMT